MLKVAGVQFLKDNPELAMNAKLIFIHALYYSSEKSALGGDHSESHDSLRHGECLVHQNNLTAIKLRMKEGYPQLPLLRQILFRPTCRGHSACGDFHKPLDYSQSNIWRNRRASLDDVQKLFISSEVIEYQIVDNSKGMLMCVLLAVQPPSRHRHPDLEHR